MGRSVDYIKGGSRGFDIATIEVELLNLVDFIGEQIDSGGTKYLEELIDLSVLHLKLAIIKLALNIDPGRSLLNAQRFIDLAMEEVNEILENNKLTVEMAEFFLVALENCYIEINEIIYNSSN